MRIDNDNNNVTYGILVANLLGPERGKGRKIRKGGEREQVSKEKATLSEKVGML